jgi:NAD(P)-dependent dehydrogenase (short-subunit alcohol dehydrogenase family)
MSSKDLFSMHGERVLVTGASSGLGQHFARVLAEAGADVAVAARRVGPLESLCEEIRAMGRKACAVEMDVCDSASVSAGVALSAATLGGVSVLVNNAGITETVPFVKQTEDSWRRIIDTNVNGAWLVARAVVEHMMEVGEGGNVVNVASVMSTRVAGHLTAYCTSKGAILQLTQSMGLDLARYNVRVNAIAPGYIHTPFNQEFFQSEAGQKVISRIPQRRLGEVDDLNGAILLLSSRASAYMTGSVVTVDGGHLQSTL